MKKFSAKINYDEYSAKYTVMADDKKQAIEKIYKISGQRVGKVIEEK